MALLFIISFSLLLSFVFFNLSSFLNILVILEKSNPDIIVTQVTQVTLVTQVTVVTLVTLVTLVNQVTLVTLVTLVTQVTLVTLITLVAHPSHPISQLSHPSQSNEVIFLSCSIFLVISDNLL